MAAGILFAWLVPILHIAPSKKQAFTFSACILAVAFLVYLIGGPRVALRKLTALFEASVQNIGRIVMWLLLVMALVQFAVVIMRYVFGVNFIFMQESVTYMHGAVFLLAAGYALLTSDHVRVDIFYRDAAPKRKALIDLAGTYLFLFPICLLLFWTASPYVANSWAVGEGSAETSGIQAVYLIKSFIPAFAALLAMAGFVIAGRASLTLKGAA